MTAMPVIGDNLWATEFLQSAVVLDDQAQSLGGEEAVGMLVHPKGAPGRRVLSDETREAVEPDTRGRELNDLDSKALTDAFASYGVVCGVLCPSSTDIKEESSRLLKTARLADIVILDWQIIDDDGVAAKSIIEEIVKSASTRNAFKLVCVYTADVPHINNIIPEIHETLVATGEKVQQVDAYQLSIGATRIALFSKVELNVPDEQLAQRYASEADLPERVVEIFESMATGLLGRFAMRALATLRRNTHSIAGKFSTLLDAGYLWHRAALPDPSDAEEHVREILSNELDSIIEVSDSIAAANADECGRVVDAFSEPLNTRFAIKDAVSYDDIKTLLDGVQLSDIGKRIRKKLRREDHPALDIIGFADTVESATLANEQFAMLMLLRTHYDETPRGLHLGTVLRGREDEKDVYYICMQPLCDSRRLSEARRFPLLPLEMVEKGRFNLVLPITKDTVGHFLALYNPYRLEMREFNIEGGRGDVPVAREGEAYKVVDTEKREYELIAELRTPIAHRIAQKIANQFGRIGLDVPEWIREKD